MSTLLGRPLGERALCFRGMYIWSVFSCRKRCVLGDMHIMFVYVWATMYEVYCFSRKIEFSRGHTIITWSKHDLWTNHSIEVCYLNHTISWLNYIFLHVCFAQVVWLRYAFRTGHIWTLILGRIYSQIWSRARHFVAIPYDSFRLRRNGTHRCWVRWSAACSQVWLVALCCVGSAWLRCQSLFAS